MKRYLCINDKQSNNLLKTGDIYEGYPSDDLGPSLPGIIIPKFTTHSSIGGKLLPFYRGRFIEIKLPINDNITIL